MNRKILAISLIALAALVSVLGVVTMTALADTSGTNTNNTATQDPSSIQQFGGMQMMEQGFMGPGGRGHGMGMGNIEVSSEFNTTVNNILSSDTDVANLTSQGYTVASIHPILKSVIAGDGTVTTKATTAKVIMTNGTSGIARITVDITNAKVTYIETVTRTIIDKSNS